MLTFAGMASAELTVKEWYPQENDYVFVCGSSFTATSWDWDFGDGMTQTSSNNQDVFHAFAADGTYTVTCTAHGDGMSETHRLTVTVGDDEEPPVDPPEEPVEGTAIIVTGEDGLDVSFRCQNDFDATVFDWNFGDGTQLLDVSDESLTHTYAAPGTYDVSCTAWAAGHSAEIGWDRIDVSGDGDEPPVDPPEPGEDMADVVVTSTDGLTVELQCDDNFGATHFDWNFRDGTAVFDLETDTLSHTYAEAGTYGVTCTAWSAEDGAQVGHTPVSVMSEEPPAECASCEGEYTLTASKTYGPSNWTDGMLDLCTEQEFLVPSSIPVTAGNAGNHWATLGFNAVIANSTIATTCVYQGGSDQAHPVGEEQLALGMSWEFVGCFEDYDGSTPPTQNATAMDVGDSFVTDIVTLHVNGDSEQGTTEATLTLDNQLVCEAT